MGRYLAIGITIDLSFEKKKAAREFASLEAGVKYVEEHYAPLDLYEKAEDDEEAGWKELLARGINANDAIIGIAASGTTPYVIGALRHGKENGILTGCITSNPGAPVTEVCDVPMVTVVGPEYVTGSSRMKSGTAQKLVLNMISTSLMIKLGRVKGNKMVNMQLTNKKLVDRGTRMVVEELNIPYDEAKELLLRNGSAKKAIDAFRENSHENN